MKLNLQYPQFIAEALFNKAKHTVIHAGRQVGKTYNTAQWLIEETLANNCKSLWVDTVHINIDRYVDWYFKKILYPIWELCKWNAQKKVLQLPKGSIIFGSAQKPENLEGFNYDRYVLNEAGLILKKSSLWDNTLYPMIKNDNVRGKVIGTPKGRNKFYELALQGRSGNPDYATFHYSVYDSPYWTQLQIETAKSVAPELVWSQEYMAEFVEGEGVVFRRVREVVRDINNEVVAGRNYVMGIDLAKHVDYTVIIVFDVDTRELVYMDRFNKIDWVLQKNRIISAWERWNRPQAIIDSTGVGDSVFDELQSRGMTITPFRFNNSNKAEIVRNLSIAIENKELSIPNNQLIIDELESYEYEISASGNITYSAPDGLHDDIVMAMCLAWRLIKDIQIPVVTTLSSLGL